MNLERDKTDLIYKIAHIGLHQWEEPCLTGMKGSGTIFFSGCTLKCLFCQNQEISHGGRGIEVSENELLFLMLYLQSIGATNINLVTPSHYAAKLAETLKKAKQFLYIPIVYNTSAYESVTNLKKLEGLVDIYLPDFKYYNDTIAEEYSSAKNYFYIASNAIREMKRQQPVDVYDEDVMKKGVIVRHLALPNLVDDSKRVLDEIAKIDTGMTVSLMSQYFPTSAVKDHKTLGRRLNPEEYDQLVEYFFTIGLSNGFSQEPESAIEDYVPSWDEGEQEIKKVLESFWQTGTD